VVLLDGLEAQGLVTRTRSATDRRHHELALTEEGQAMMGRLRTVATAHEDDVVSALSDREREQLGRLLDKLATAHGLEPEVHPGYRPPVA
jgi:DNA-binding MarR family transcriptional regulator